MSKHKITYDEQTDSYSCSCDTDVGYCLSPTPGDNEICSEAQPCAHCRLWMYGEYDEDRRDEGPRDTATFLFEERD